MSLFDYPRINFAGNIVLNPGTANNDDFAPQNQMPSNWGPFAGAPLALVDSKFVEARTYGMSDQAFIDWVQQPQPFAVTGQPGATQTFVPAEWNYYGDMTSSATASVTGVETGPGQLYTAPDPSSPVSALVGAPVTFGGGITDVNSQGSPPATQFFIENFTLKDDATLSGVPSKGACQWLNFYRNVNEMADGGAGGYVYHVMLRGQGKINIPGIPPDAYGVVIRYYIYNVNPGNNPLPQPNPATGQIVGTIAPLRKDEEILTGPVGRLMVANNATIWPPPGAQNNNNATGLVALAPAVLQAKGDVISADLSGTFPEYAQGSANPKFDFGEVSLAVTGGGATVTIGPVPYTDVTEGNARGWIFDFDIAGNAAAKKAMGDPEAAFSLVHPVYGTVLSETSYYFVSNQQAIYAEQHGRGDLFLNQGTTEPLQVYVWHRGRQLSRAECPQITVWQYRSIPLEAPGNVTVLSTIVKPGDHLTVDTSQPGNYLLTFTINDDANPAPNGYPPLSYLTFQGPPWITNAPSVSLRILPNNEDFSQFYADPSAADPVGNERLTFDVVYAKVLRTYYLLFPAMNQVFPLNDEKKVRKMAPAILDRTSMHHWMTIKYMPRTRDLSASRKQLLQAWCRKVIAEGPPPC